MGSDPHNQRKAVRKFLSFGMFTNFALRYSHVLTLIGAASRSSPVSVILHEMVVSLMSPRVTCWIIGHAGSPAHWLTAVVFWRTCTSSHLPRDCVEVPSACALPGTRYCRAPWLLTVFCPVSGTLRYQVDETVSHVGSACFSFLEDLWHLLIWSRSVCIFSLECRFMINTYFSIISLGVVLTLTYHWLWVLQV